MAKREVGRGDSDGSSKRSTRVSVVDLNFGTIRAKVGFWGYSFFDVTGSIIP